MMKNLTEYNHYDFKIDYSGNTPWRNMTAKEKTITNHFKSLKEAKEFNEILDYCNKNFGNYKPIEFTEKGYVKKKKGQLTGYIVQYDGLKMVIDLITPIGKETLARYHFIFTTIVYKDKDGMTGRKAFERFKQLCLAQGIDLEEYKLTKEYGTKVKETIELPLIKLTNPLFKDQTIENVNHVDFHNSYPAGLCNTHEEFRKVIEPIYKNRKNNPENKAVLNYTIGFMQKKESPLWANLSRDAIADNNKRVRELAQRLADSGHMVISYNTDGIWYQGAVYHGDGEGDDLGQWHNDHVNCRFRAKSAGSYEFIENGSYFPVVRGKTRLDNILTRDKWQ